MTTPNTPANGGQILTDLLQELLDEYLATMSSAYCQVDADEELVAKVRASLAAPAIPTVDRNAVLEEVAKMLLDGVFLHDQAPPKLFADEAAVAIRAMKSATPVAQPAAQVAVSDAARDMLAERQRQMQGEGWTPEHDDEHGNGELAVAAACYAVENSQRLAATPPPSWPWDTRWWKPKGNRRNLVKAGALILAEIERIDRATPATVKTAEGL